MVLLKRLLLIGILSCIFQSHAQHSSGGGTFPEYKNTGITKVEEYYYDYSGLHPCDSTPRNTKFYNEKGQMVKEVFGSRYSPYYTYSYNEEGFLVDIDTNGLFGFGRGVPISLKDTLFEHIETKETWFTIDTMKRLKKSVSYSSNNSTMTTSNFDYDSIGRLIQETRRYQNKGDSHMDTITVYYEYNEFNLLNKTIVKEEEQVLHIKEFKFYTTH